MDIQQFHDLLKALGTVVPSGSYFICGTTDTDVDFFVDNTNRMQKFLVEQGFETNLGGDIDSCGGIPDFLSLRKGNINVILVPKGELKKIKLATELCTELKLTVKEDRLRVFNAIRYGKVSALKSTELEK